MYINDKREAEKNLIFFKELDLGDVYEDEDGYVCIKTSYADDYEEINCLVFQSGDWEAEHQNLDTKVTRVEAELVLRRSE